MKQLANGVREGRSKFVVQPKPWRPSPGLMPRLEALAPDIDKLPEHRRHHACKLLADAISSGLSDERQTEIDKLIEEVKRRR